MQQINATDFTRHTGAIIDRVLREGMLAVIRHHRLAALLSRDPVAVPEGVVQQTITAVELWNQMSTILDGTRCDTTAYTITRNGRPVAYLLPRRMLRELGLEL